MMINEVFAAATVLFLLMDPVGNIPLLLGMLNRAPVERHRIIILRENIFAFCVLVSFLFGGKYIISYLHLSNASLSIAGGIILFMVAIRMIFPAKNGMGKEPNEEEGEPFLVPLGVPMIAGPSAMATIMLANTREPEKWPVWLAALVVVSSISLTMHLSSRWIARKVGNRFLKAMERLMGMILTTLGVEMLLTGIDLYIQSLK